MRVAIMQPTYLPWIGYFSLINSVDLFVFLDDVQFERRSWQQRNRIKTMHGSQWLTIPVLSKGRRTQKVNEVVIDLPSGFSERHKETIRHTYRQARFFEDSMRFIEDVIPARFSNLLADYSIEGVRQISAFLDVCTETIRSSSLGSTGQKAQLLANICVEVGARTYISPPGSYPYLNESDCFLKAGIPVEYFKFTPTEYPQLYSGFISHLSVVDAIFNCGPETAELI